MGGNGIVLLGGTYSQEPSIAAAYDVPGACWLPLDGLLGPEDGKLPYTLAEEQPWLALQTEEDAVRLLDLRLGRELRVLRGTPPAEDVVRLVFADHDRPRIGPVSHKPCPRHRDPLREHPHDDLLNARPEPLAVHLCERSKQDPAYLLRGSQLQILLQHRRHLAHASAARL